MASNFAGAIAPPPGIEPDFVNPTSLYPGIVTTVVLITSLTTVFAVARLAAKRSFSPWTIEDCM